MAIRPSKGVPMYAVVEDSPERLVLATRGSRYFGAGLFGVLAIPFLVVFFRESGPVALACGVLGGLSAAGALYSLLSWRRYTFDVGRGEVRFDSLLFGRFVSKFSEIDEIRAEYKERKTRDEDGSVGTFFVWSLFLVIGGKRHEINRSAGQEFIEDLRSRIEKMAPRLGRGG
jgi:hypothetical protein